MKAALLSTLLLVTCVLGLAVGCGPQGERCRKCGMLVDEHPRWIAGLTNAAGAEERFCSPRCLFAYWRGPKGQGHHGGWVTEYYTQKHTPVDEVIFVAGSDITGPMGKALVPIKGRDQAEQFLQDHHGTRLLAATNITLTLLKELAGKAKAR